MAGDQIDVELARRPPGRVQPMGGPQQGVKVLQIGGEVTAGGRGVGAALSKAVDGTPRLWIGPIS